MKAAKAHFIADSLISPCMKDDMVTLSNIIVSSRVNVMSSNIKHTVTQLIEYSSHYTIQLHQ